MARTSLMLLAATLTGTAATPLYAQTWQSTQFSVAREASVPLVGPRVELGRRTGEAPLPDAWTLGKQSGGGDAPESKTTAPTPGSGTALNVALSSDLANAFSASTSASEPTASGRTEAPASSADTLELAVSAPSERGPEATAPRLHR
jgi:hypothetical protein